MGWIKSSKKDMEVTFSYSPLEYSLIKLVGPMKKAQIFLNFPQKMHLTYQKHSHQFIEAFHTVGTLEKQCNVP